jgi:hypothetical protein
MITPWKEKKKDETQSLSNKIKCLKMKIKKPI